MYYGVQTSVEELGWYRPRLDFLPEKDVCNSKISSTYLVQFIVSPLISCCVLCHPVFELQILTKSDFQPCSSEIERVLLCEEIGNLVYSKMGESVCTESRANGDQLWCDFSPRREAPSVLHWVQKLLADCPQCGDEATYRVRPTSLGILYYAYKASEASTLTDRRSVAVIYDTSTYPRRAVRRVRFSWSLGPSPRQPTVVWRQRDAPTADCASGARQR